jgi:hypothetical protein
MDCGPLEVPEGSDVDKVAEKHCKATRHPVATRGVPASPPVAGDK